MFNLFKLFKKKELSLEELEAKEREKQAKLQAKRRKEILKMARADRKSLVKYKDSIEYQIPFDILIDNKTFFIKYGGFGRVIKIRNFDTDYLDDSTKYHIYSKFNNLFKSMPENSYFHYDLIRKKAEIKKPEIRPYAPLTTRLCEEMRYKKFQNMNFFQNEIYITFSYIMPSEKVKAIQDFILQENKFTGKKNKKAKKLGEDDAQSYEFFMNEHRKFEENFNMFLGLLRNAVLEWDILTDSDLMNYLSYSVNPLDEVKNINRLTPPIGFPLDEYIPFSDITNLETLKVGDYYTKIISQNNLPNEITNTTLRRIFSLPFEIRFTTRFIPLTKEEAVAMIEGSKKFHSAKRFSALQYVIMASDKEQIKNMPEDEHEAGLTEEARLLMQDLMNDRVGYGHLSQVLIIQDKDLKVLDEHLQTVLKEFMSVDIKAVDDKWNALDAYVGAIPSNVNANIRKMPIHTTAFPYFIPTNNSWNGSPYSNVVRDESLIQTLNNAGELFHFNFFDGDVGNTIILGKIGNGKSVLLNGIANYAMKYKNSQIFFFDVDSSSRVLCKANNGVFYDIGGEKDNISFQPLKRLDTNQEMIWANDFITSLIAQEDEKLITPKNKEEIWKAITSLHLAPISERTITSYSNYLQNNDLKLALKPYTNDGAYGKFFDGNNEQMSDTQMVVFELGKIIGTPKVVSPLVMYLTNYIETQKLQKGYPTFVLVDEAHAFFRNPYFAPYLDRQLLTSRKKNCHYIFATQSGTHILESPISSSIIDQCFTKILLPNRDVTSDWLEIYKKFGLNDAEIDAIRQAEPKRDYFIKNGQGSTLFSLQVTPIDLAYIGTASKEMQNMIDEIRDNTNTIKTLNVNWLQNLERKGKISKFDLEMAIDIISKMPLSK